MSPLYRLSIGTNIALMGIVAVLYWHDQSAIRSPVALSARPAAAWFDTMKANAAAGSPRSKSAGSQLTATAVAELEQMGVSRETLINVLLADLNRWSAKQFLELQKKYAPRVVPDREMRELSRRTDAEQIRALKAVFGEEGYLAWDKQQTLRNLNRARAPGDDLPMTADEAEQAYRMQKEFDEKNQELQMAMEDGVADRADAGTLLAQAQQTLDGDLEKLLGKQRFSELRGNIDPASEIYRTYGDLNPTPDQAKAVLLAEGDYRTSEAALTQRLTENPGDTANIMAQLKVISDARDQNLRQIFGSEAYDNMKRETDPAYKTLQQYASAWDLTGGEVQSVYETIHAFQDQADQTRSAAEMSEAAGQRVNWREIDSTIQQARAQTEAGLQTMIGGERLRRIEQNGVLTNR